MNACWPRSVSAALPGIIWSTDVDLRIITADGAGISAFGDQASDLPGRHLSQVFKTDNPSFPPLRAHHNALRGQASPIVFHVAEHSFGGQVAPCYKSDRIVGVTMLAVDNEPYERKYTSIADTAFDLIFCLQLDGTIDDINRTGKQLARDQIIGRSIFDFVPNNNQADLHQAIQSVIHTGKVSSLEITLEGRLETETWHAIRIGAIQQRGNITGLILVANDITQAKTNARRLEAEELLLRRLLDLQERERRMVAYEIHDGFIQDVIGARMMLQSLQASTGDCNQEVTDELECSLSLLNRAINDGRRLISELRPMIIDEMGIVEAIQYLTEEEEGLDQMEIQFEHRLQTEQLEPLLQANLFRIAREAVTNARRHGKARHANIRLTQIGEQHVVLEIRDDGDGFDPNQVPEDRFGLAGIRERARLFGGGATIESYPKEGTLITVKLPLQIPLSARTSSDPSWQWTI